MGVTAAVGGPAGLLLETMFETTKAATDVMVGESDSEASKELGKVQTIVGIAAGAHDLTSLGSGD